MYNKPFVISKKKGETYIKYYSGKVKKYNLLNEISKDEQIFVVPFSQAKERDFIVNDQGEKIISIIIEEKKEFKFEDFKQTFKEKDSILEKDLQEYFSEQEYKDIVRNIVEKEIGQGEGANFLIAQKISSKIKDFDIETALSIFKRLLLGDYGSYLHFMFFDGEKIFIGASPERNVSIEGNKDCHSELVSESGKENTNNDSEINSEGQLYKVRMNPISGTFKKASYKNYLDFRKDFLEFLQDQKEINELFMATDEELKMMSNICTSGGIIVGPILKEMANLVHTEYLLSGNSSLDKIEIFKKSMWASTVVGSPIESAFRVIKKYENFSRKYYAGAICHQEKDSLDSAIMIRTLELDLKGNFDIFVGASLVKDSVPKKEYEEINIKSAGLINAILGINKKSLSFTREYYLDDEVQELVQNRNQNLSKTWFFKQKKKINKKFKNKNCLIINNEDDFTNMLAHLLKLIGLNVDVIRYNKIPHPNPLLKERGQYVLNNYDYVLIGPGPGNPLDNNEKMQKNLEIIDYVEKNGIKYFGICLGHQLISRYKNLDLQKKDIPTQGEQIEIDLFGETELVAFYNTFISLKQDNKIDCSINKDTKEIYAMKGKNFFSFQFHPESILTKNGLDILEKYLLEL